MLSRLPIHNLSKKGRVNIHITQKNAHGDIALRWEVSYSERYGQARQLAYKLDTIMINRRLDDYHRPLPHVIRLGSLADLAHQCNLCRDTNSVKKALLQNAATFITAKLRYTATDGTEHTLEAGFTRYSVVFTGERLPDGTTADAVYLLLNEPYWEVLNHDPTRPLDYDYLKALPPAAQRCYEILSYKLFTALKYRHPHAQLLYSAYCTFSAQQRYLDYTHVKKQMYKVHKPHLTSEYLESVRYEATTDEDGRPDWVMYYVPGSKARAEYAAFNTRPRRRPARPAAGPQHPEQVTTPAPPSAAAATVVPATPSLTADETLTAQAQALVQHFHQRFHGTSDVVPSARALTQARALIARDGLDQARHLVDFSVTAAQETDYRPQTFGGILQYTARARANYAQAQERQDAAARERKARRRVQEEEQLQRQYEDDRAARLAELRATTPPDVLAAVEQAAAAHFEQEHTSPFGRDLLRRYALDDAVAAHFQIPSLAEWQATQDPQEGKGDT
ncbi:MAG: hypothetical protein L0177_01785, partial [Chloroflexi bacterium]|nr:hypothetical protein [Chloroflexota bacterium]